MVTNSNKSERNKERKKERKKERNKGTKKQKERNKGTMKEKGRNKGTKKEKRKKIVLPAGRRVLHIPKMTLRMMSCRQSRKVPMLIIK